jgi:hypothetical protein
VKDRISLFLIAGIIVLTAIGVYSNVRQQLANDFSKIPQKVELDRGFQRWITNLKNKGLEINADEFKMVEENEIYNSMWMKVYSIDDSEKKALFDNTIQSLQNTKKVVFSPSGREFIDYRNEIRDGYTPCEVRFFGQKEDKIIDARLLSGNVAANCYFDRAYFLDNDVFVISEFSRNIKKNDTAAPTCAVDVTCTYTVKLHVVDLIRNSRYVYESEPFEAVLSTLVKQL